MKHRLFTLIAVLTMFGVLIGCGLRRPYGKPCPPDQARHLSSFLNVNGGKVTLGELQATDSVCQPGLYPIRTFQLSTGTLYEPICIDPVNQTIYFNGSVSGYVGTPTTSGAQK